jgi:hypothetical protein
VAAVVVVSGGRSDRGGRNGLGDPSCRNENELELENEIDIEIENEVEGEVHLPPIPTQGREKR